MNTVVFYTLDYRFELQNPFIPPEILDVKFGARTRAYDVYYTTSMQSPVFEKNRFGNQSVVIEIALEKDPQFRYFETLREISQRKVVEIDGILYDYVMSEETPIDYMGKRFGTFLVELDVGMAYNIIEGHAGDMIRVMTPITDYMLDVDYPGDVTGFDKLISVTDEGVINSTINMGWEIIYDYFMPFHLIEEVPIGGKNIVVSSNVRTFRYKEYK